MSDIHNIFSIKITPTRITDSTFYFVIFIVGHNSLSVCLYGYPQLYAGYLTDQLSVSSIFFNVTSTLHNIFSIKITPTRITDSTFYFVIFIVGHNSLSVCLYGYPQLYAGYLTDQLSVSSIFLNVTST